MQVRSSDVLNQWLGGSEAAIREVFASARAAAPCVLLFDELDSLATNREEEDGGAGDVHSRILSTLLNEMDGISSNRKKWDVLVVAATNRLDFIDAALLRPGRLDEHVHLPKPSATDCTEIFKAFTNSLPLGADVDVELIGSLLWDLKVTGAQIEGICRGACLLALRKHRDEGDDHNIEVSLADFKSILAEFEINYQARKA